MINGRLFKWWSIPDVVNARNEAPVWFRIEWRFRHRYYYVEVGA